MVRGLLISLIGLLVVGVAKAGDVVSGPKAGEKVEPFKVYGVVGKVEKKEVDYVKERKDEPTVYVFVQAEHFTRPMARYFKKLDGASKEADEKSQVIIVWLTEKKDEAKDYMPKLNTSLQFANTWLTVFEGEKSGPNNWGINTDAHLTVVVATKGKVAATFAYNSVNDTDVPKVAEAIKKAAEKK